MKRTLVIVVLLSMVAGAALAAQEAKAEPMGAILPIALNFFPGLGVGSFVQGDGHGGVVGLVLDIAGYGLFIYGSVELMAAVSGAAAGSFFSALLGGTADNSSAQAMGRRGAICVLAGTAVWAGSKVYGVVRPLVFARDYNRQHGLASLALSPTLVPACAGGGTEFAPGILVELDF
jgi:hypothetical protein